MRVTRPTPDEMDALFMMGFDTWGHDVTEQMYLASCHDSPKYALGEWSVLADGGEMLSSLITYQCHFGLSHRCYGIGSIATSPRRRGQGYGSRLVCEVIETLEQRDALAVYLFSDIGKRFYERLGFAEVEGAVSREGSIPMVRQLDTSAPLPRSQPSYF